MEELPLLLLIFDMRYGRNDEDKKDGKSCAMHWIELQIIIFILKIVSMIGGLSRALRFKNVNGSCLIDCILNSILNSHEMVVKLYELTSASKSLNNDFIELLNINESFDKAADIYKLLLSAFVHDYIHEIHHIDKDKILFAMLNDSELGECDKIREAGEMLQEEYRRFNHNTPRRINSFILSGTRLAQLQEVMFGDCNKLYRSLPKDLHHYKDIYIKLSTAPDEFKTVLDLNKREIKVINGLFKAAITSTSEYLCTDMILYKGDNVDYLEYSHVVYYNVLDETLVDNNVKEKIPLKSLVVPSACTDYVSYIEATNSHTVYVPCILHYQKIQNSPQALGLTGKIDDYSLKHNARIEFIKNEIAKYTEKWYENKVKSYTEELESS